MEENFYLQQAYNNIISQLNKEVISKETLDLLNNTKVYSVLENNNEIAYNTLNGNIYMNSNKNLLSLLEKSSKFNLNDSESMFLLLKKIEIDGVLPHEIAHNLETREKIIGTKIYNEKILPKILNGDLGIYDENSYIEHIDKLRDLMENEFKNNFNPTTLEFDEFKDFSEEYFFPEGSFGLTNRISMIDNYITDISIENYMVGIHNNPKIIDDNFKMLRDLLYDNNENYSLLKCMQIYIDPRYENSKELSKVLENEDFKDFLEININNLNISDNFYKASTPDEYEKMKMISIMNELRESVRKIREYAYLIGAYYKYKDEELKNKIELLDINKRTIKLAKVIYIKELEGNIENENLINQIIRNDDMLGKKFGNYKETNDLIKNENFKEPNLFKYILPKPNYKETLLNIGHNNDFSYNLNNMNLEIMELLMNNFNLKEFQENFKLNQNDSLIINNIFKKDVQFDNAINNNELIENRIKLINELKSSSYYKVLKNRIDELDKNITNKSKDLIFIKKDNQKQNINIFISDNLKSKELVNEYTFLDYQIANSIIIKELFENKNNFKVSLINIPDKNYALSILNKNILPLDGIKDKSFDDNIIIESVIKNKDTNNRINDFNLIFYDEKIDIYNNSLQNIKFKDSLNEKLLFLDSDFLKENDLLQILNMNLDQYFLEISNKNIEFNDNSI